MLSVGIALGAAVAMSTVVRAVLLAPLPYEDPAALVWIYTDNPPYRFRFSRVDYRALEADHPAFSAVAAYETSSATVAEGDGAERVTVKAVTGSYFPLLGQRPHLGRLLGDADERRDERPAVLTYRYWMRRLGGDPSVIGRALRIDGTVHTIVGILQRDVGPLEHGVAAFTLARWPQPKRKGPFMTMVLGRLRPDVSREAAIDMLRATNAGLFPIWRSSYQDEKATWGMMDLKARVVGDTGTTLWFVLAAVGCMLLIACSNALNLLMARGLQRSRELAIRGALGASRGRLLQHVLLEAAALSAGAAVVALGVALGALRLVAAYGSEYIPRLDEVRFSLGDLPGAYVILRTMADPASVAPSVRQALRELDPGLPLSNVATGDELVSASLATPRYLTVVTAMFAVSALALAIVGVYGVMSHFVQQRRRDIGIRLALGGDPGRMRSAVVLQGLALVGSGVAAGLVVTLAAGRLVRTLLFAVSPADPLVLVGVPAGLVTAAAIACLLPARRAARLDPAHILREE